MGSRSTEGWSSDFGLDLKYSIASNLTLDTTFNPDFAHIEADENQINLTRFELFLEEKRPFFLEGQNLFTAMDLFYSRRISDPDAGAKITGKIGKNSIGMIAARNRPADEDRDQYDFADDYLGYIRRVSGILRFDLWEGFFLDSSTESVWEYFPSGELDEVKRVLLVRTTYFLHRDLFIRSFFQRSFHRDTVDLNLLFSYIFGPNNSRFYIAYNEHRTDTTARLNSPKSERILLTKLSYRFNF